MTLAIDIQNVSKKYEHFHLNDVSFQVEEGSVMGLIGPNGAGKSTTLQILMGFATADAGSIRLLGHQVPAEIAVAKQNVAYVSDSMQLHGNATLGWHMRLIQSFCPAWDQAYAERLLKRFGLIAHQKTREFSQGQRVKSLLLLAFARHPKLLVLDEPTTGLDPVARHEVNSELMRVVEDEGRSILFSSHNVADVEQFCDTITFLDRGKVIASECCTTYLDRWQRIRIELPELAALPHSDHWYVEQHSSRHGVIVTPAFDDRVFPLLQEIGASIRSVERMTLEEIFVSSVMMRREEFAK